MLSRPPCVLLAALLLATPASAELTFFGYSAVLCGLDDPHDDSTKSDYVDEVAGFTNLNHVCLTDDIAQNGKRLQRAAQHFTPMLDVSPIFFEAVGDRTIPTRNRDFLLEFLAASITASKVSPDQMMFYLVDEPTLRGLTPEDVAAAADRLKAAYPETPIVMVEAYRHEGPPPIPASVDYWGFDAYTVPDPGAEPLYTAFIDAAAAKLLPHQSLIMVMDGNYTPYHRDAGLTEAAMADVAKAYYDYALRRGDVAMLLTYTWAGGIDHDAERGTRDLDPVVIKMHRWIGHEITGKTGP